ncbi:MAG: hypothetical protein CLLPBCKN_003552 [Chroococcidiopsis cubana SAG 39.79]|nr:hypothetical protein [Chroococcidiopsis cubana SAG 39.79]
MMWFKTRGTRKYYPFLNYEPWLDTSLLEIRQKFDLLPFINRCRDVTCNVSTRLRIWRTGTKRIL